jgi:curved DNA-binding protein CbpA
MALGADPYEVLGVPRDASDDQIARARRQLSRAYHPDVNRAPDAAARFDEVQQAYHRLSGTRPQGGRDRDDRGGPGATRSPPQSRPDFAPGAQAGTERREPLMPEHLKIWLLAVVFALILLVYLVVTTR